jgi:class 3 adenylate cyclase/tetratricopeptide (TPR) repeat protein
MVEPASTRPEGEQEPREDAGRRCHVTVLFSDVCDYTTLAEALDPEDAYRLRRYVEQLVTGVMRKHGGTISQFYGDGTLAVFGYPTSEEEDSRRAIEAALELRELTHGPALEGLIPPGFKLCMHFGIHSGLVFAREGDSLHGRFELTGDAVNTAARLCSAAGQDEVIASDSALRGIEAFYHTELLQDLTLKGKRIKVVAARVLRPSGVTTRFEARVRRGLSTLVARESELAQVDALMRQAEGGSARVATLVGGPGIGKTRLLEELRHRFFAAGVTVLRGYCESYGSLAPLQPFLHVLRQLIGVSANNSVETSIQAVHTLVDRYRDALERHTSTFLHILSLKPWTGAGPTTEHARFAIAAAFIDLFEALTRNRPLVLIFDDFQWSDDLSQQTLARVVESLAARRVLVLLGTRELDATDPVLQRAHVMTLSPLDQGDSARLIRELLPGALDLGLTSALHQRSGGNPLFLEELCRALPVDMPIAESVLDQARVPYTVQGLIQVRLEQLPAPLTAVLAAASVIGNELSRDLLARIVEGPERLDAELAELTRLDLLYASDTPGVFRFKHGITREVVYESVRLGERRRLHAAVARVIEEQLAGGGLAELEALACHYLGAGDHERAAQYAERAGDKAMVSSSLDRARLQYGAALAELERAAPVDVREDARKARALKRAWLIACLKWARAWVYDPSPEHLHMLERAARTARELGDDGLLALGEAEHWSSWFCYALGDQARALGHCRAGLEIAQSVSSEKLIAQLESNLGQSYVAAGEYDEALGCLARALASKRARVPGAPTVPPQAPPSGDERSSHIAAAASVPIGFAYALANQGFAHGDMGDYARCEAEMEAALEVLRGTGHAIEASILGLRTMMRMLHGHWEACIESAVLARAAAQRVHGPYVFAITQSYSAIARFKLTGDRSVLEDSRKAIDWLERRGIGLFVSTSFASFADALFEIGDISGAQDYAGRALARAARKDRIGESSAHRTLARIHASAVLGRLGQPATAAHQARLHEALVASLTTAVARKSRRDIALGHLLIVELGAQGVSAAWSALDQVPGIAGAPGANHDLTARASIELAHVKNELDAMGMTSYRKDAEMVPRVSSTGW